MISGPFETIPALFKSMPDWLVDLFFVILPIFLLCFLGWLAYDTYKNYIQEKFIAGIKWTLFEIKLPPEVDRTPLAMELIIQSLHQGGGVGTWVKRFVEGSVLLWFSLEVVSQEGRVRFFIRTPNKFKEYLKSQIYAQYPQAEVLEVEDYTKSFPRYDKDVNWKLFGAEFKLDKPDPYPLKTYVDYNMDKEQSLKPFQKIDPLNQVIEFMGSMQPREHIWWQTIIRFHPKRFNVSSSLFKKQTWVEEAQALRGKLLKDFKIKITDKEGKVISDMGELTSLRKEVLDAIEKSVSKYGFDVGIRVIYLAETKNDFRPERIPAMLSMFKPFGTLHLNSLKPDGDSIPDFDYAWQDKSGEKKEKRKKDLYEGYVSRGYFNTPFNKKPFILNTEELATIFHFPGQSSTTPGLNRVGSRTAKPPSNLPNN